MRILGIETSCDETAVSVVHGDYELRNVQMYESTNGIDSNLKVEHNRVSSQIDIHKEFGGVVPEVAARMHLEVIFSLLKEVDMDSIDAIAVTSGPGLMPALRTGVEAAKTLAWMTGKPLIPLSHLEGHIYANWLKEEAPKLPALCLIVSGGHTELVIMKDHGAFQKIGETIDDAAGEAFDKVAKMLGLSYPGGPAIAKLAEAGDRKAIEFPRGLLHQPNLDFSFSGVKTSVLYYLRKNEDQIEDKVFRADVAASFQEAVVDVLIAKTKKALAQHEVKSLLLAGGVSANIELRHRLLALGDVQGIAVHIPKMKYTMDNAAMIAAAGYFRVQDEANRADPLVVHADSNLGFVT
jgi:N6-L-threonylcarbamoyladenine synthase